MTEDRERKTEDGRKGEVRRQKLEVQNEEGITRKKGKRNGI